MQRLIQYPADYGSAAGFVAQPVGATAHTHQLPNIHVARYDLKLRVDACAARSVHIIPSKKIATALKV